MCKIICVSLLYVLYINSFYVFGFNESVVDVLRNSHSPSGPTVVNLGKKIDFSPRFEALKHRKSTDDDMEDDEDRGDEDDDDQMDEKDDSVDTELNEAEERHSEEEQMLEEAEDVGVKESIEEEKAESSYASKATGAKGSETKGPGNGTLRSLMDQMVKLSLELKEINNQINSLV